MDNIYNQIINSTLYDKINEIRCCIHCPDEQYLSHNFFKDKKVVVREIYVKNIGNTFEKKTLDMLLKDSKNDNFYVLYLHSKGVSNRHQNADKTRNIKTWTDYLLFFNIEKHEYILKKLEEYDVVGVNLNGNSCKEYHKKYKDLHDFITQSGSLRNALTTGLWPYHYSGNFWWSKSSYIKQINICEPYYPAAEFWITNGNNGQIGKFLCLYRGCKNFYNIAHPKEEYKNKELDIYERKN